MRNSKLKTNVMPRSQRGRARSPLRAGLRCGAARRGLRALPGITQGLQTNNSKPCIALLVLSLLAVSELQAQFFPGGGGGLPGGAGTTSRSGTTRRYPNNGVGTATFSVDPDTRSLVVVADPDTAK